MFLLSARQLNGKQPVPLIKINCKKPPGHLYWWGCTDAWSTFSLNRCTLFLYWWSIRLLSGQRIFVKWVGTAEWAVKILEIFSACAAGLWSACKEVWPQSPCSKCCVLLGFLQISSLFHLIQLYQLEKFGNLATLIVTPLMMMVPLCFCCCFHSIHEVISKCKLFLNLFFF